MPADLSQHPAVRLERYRRDHPEVDIPPPVEGVHRAHIPLGGTYERVVAGRTLEELLAKLDG
ncbi:MAG TPA: hypothetical protein VFQ68_42150 [Streptosporangiaceae bacterium]|nr:hypothetical protein [Streptosporangiaceae bacterium]